MNPFKQRVIELADKAKELHTREKTISLESVDLVGELQKRNASGYLMLMTRDVAKRVGLSPSQYWKRAQAARVFSYFPKVRDLVLASEISVTNVALIAPHLSSANLDVVLSGVRCKTSREVKDWVARVDFNGKVSQAASKKASLLTRVMKVAQARGRCLSRRELLDEALELWLMEWEEPTSSTKAG